MPPAAVDRNAGVACGTLIATEEILWLPSAPCSMSSTIWLRSSSVSSADLARFGVGCVAPLKPNKFDDRNHPLLVAWLGAPTTVPWGG